MNSASTWPRRQGDAPDLGKTSGMTIRCGFVLPGGSARQQLELAEVAEQHGWDGVFVWEAAFGIDAWSLLSAMAMRTERIRLGTLLTPLPWRRPWKVASQLVTLDQLSGGRAILSVGLGAVDAALGTTGEPTERRHRAELLDEGLEIIDSLLTPFGSRRHDGKHHHVDLDRPAFFSGATAVQQPRPTIWIVGLWGSEKSMARVTHGDGYLPNLPGGPGQPTHEQTADIRAWLDAHAPAGRTLDLVIEGTTPVDDAAWARATVAPYAEAGATWWIESRWGDDPHSAARLDEVRQRLVAGPPIVA
jgi:alkanesulfonate monooxygenase SsuD/methylene tetrahydromethanopterin reductase-like flavin-dependent oxidoreductase (luciferase family)